MTFTTKGDARYQLSHQKMPFKVILQIIADRLLAPHQYFIILLTCTLVMLPKYLGKSWTSPSYTYESPRDKNNKVSVHPAKTQISLGICPVWSESLLCAQWVAKGPSFLHADSKASGQRSLWSDWADAQADLSLRWAHTHFVGFVTRRLISDCGHL